MAKKILPGQTIGIIGGDESARFLAQALQTLGMQVGVLDPDATCSAGQVASWQIVADYDDQDAVERLAMQSHAVVFCTEDIDAALLRHIQPVVRLPQNIDLLEIVQDRLVEKAFLEANTIVLAPYATIVNVTDIQDAIDGIGFPCVLKLAEKKKSGLSQIVLYSPADVRNAIDLLRFGTCVLESWIPVERELTVGIVGNERGDFSITPCVETIYNKNRLHESLVPARIETEVAAEVNRIATEIAKAIDLTGLITIELFVSKTGGIYVNEISAVPHPALNILNNTANGSQYSLLAKSHCNWALGEAEIMSAGVSVSIYSQHQFTTEKLIDEKENWHFTYYGKLAKNDNIRVGHITILTDDLYQALEEIYQTEIWD